MTKAEREALDAKVLAKLGPEPTPLRELCAALGMVDKGHGRTLSGRVDASLQRWRKAGHAKPAPGQKGWVLATPKAATKRASRAGKAVAT